MTLNTPEERIAAAIWSPEDADFRDVCNAIRLQVEREAAESQLQAFSYLLSKVGQERARVLLLHDLIQEKRKAVDEYDARIRMMNANRDKLRPIR